LKLGVAFAGHGCAWEELLALVREAEALGYEAAFVDGDVSMLDRRHERDVLDGWTATVVLLARTERIAIGSIRLAHHWNAARLAQAAATAERIAPGRLRFLIAAGDRVGDRRFGLALDAPSDRARRLDETLDALRALWRGETVTRHGDFVELDGARVRPVPPGGRIPIAVAARRPRMLELVAAHADVWEVNLPPIRTRVEAAAARLEAACWARGRDPAEIGRSLWIFTRAGWHDGDAALAAYRGLHPWFGDLPDAEVAGALVTGEPVACRERLAQLAGELRLELPVVDLSGADAETARRSLRALAPK
jgi:alkanesulfonate monooxygenase SsuD/methylene tetrahydromethanopterin reductase-like flavin-dependent oxidoreductase (luciferase family)